MIPQLAGRIAVALTAWTNRHGHHAYLSTSCLHGHHGYCQTQAKRYDGSIKTAAVCKFCGASCHCPCHRKQQ